VDIYLAPSTGVWIRVTYRDHFQSGFQKVYTGENPEGAPYESWITVVEGKEHYYIVSLLTRERKVDFSTWAINLRAYQIVMETMCI
jgi:hypothetical protein